MLKAANLISEIICTSDTKYHEAFGQVNEASTAMPNLSFLCLFIEE